LLLIFHLQCHIWDADCIAHNSCVLHFVGAMKRKEKHLWYWKPCRP
jgi:hypothetical protein